MPEIRYVNLQSQFNDPHTGMAPDKDHAWMTIQFGLDKLRDLGGGELRVVAVGAYKENLKMIGPKYSNITVRGCDLQGNPIPSATPGDDLDTAFCEARPRIDGQKQDRVFQIEDATDVVLQCLDIYNGATPRNGAGVSAKQCKITIDSCCIVDNKAKENGGGFALDYCRESKVLNSFVIANKADKDGGGGWANNVKTLSVESTRFYANNAKRGGGLALIESSDVTVFKKCRFGGVMPAGTSIANIKSYANHAETGGGLYVGGNVKNLKIGQPPAAGKNTFELNEAGYGGAIAIEDESIGVAIANNHIVNNKAELAGGMMSFPFGDGGGIFVAQFDVFAAAPTRTRIDACKISVSDDNEIETCKAIQSGGGIYMRTSGNMDISGNCVIHDNKAAAGGGIYIETDCKLTLNADAVIRDNTSDGSGGGIYVLDSQIVADGPTVEHNHAVSSGGGICLRSEKGATTEYDTYLTAVGFVAEAKIRTGCRVINNDAAKDGGGIYAKQDEQSPYALSVEVSGTVVEQNTAGDNGGGLALLGVDKYDVFGCGVKTNTAKKLGGGLYASKAGGRVHDNHNMNGQIDGNNAQGGAGTAFVECKVHADTVKDNEFDTNKLVGAGGAGIDILFNKCTIDAGLTDVDVCHNNTTAAGRTLPVKDVTRK